MLPFCASGVEGVEALGEGGIANDDGGNEAERRGDFGTGTRIEEGIVRCVNDEEQAALARKITKRANMRGKHGVAIGKDDAQVALIGEAARFGLTDDLGSGIDQKTWLQVFYCNRSRAVCATRLAGTEVMQR